jgi:hypothetical protein
MAMEQKGRKVRLRGKKKQGACHARTNGGKRVGLWVENVREMGGGLDEGAAPTGEGAGEGYTKEYQKRCFKGLCVVSVNQNTQQHQKLCAPDPPEETICDTNTVP